MKRIGRVSSLLAGVVGLLISGYRLLLSPWLAPRCRFLPTCSDYALTALARHGFVAGGWLAIKRLVRCHPWGGSGIDEVPQASGCQHDHARRPGSSPVHPH